MMTGDVNPSEPPGCRPLGQHPPGEPPPQAESASAPPPQWRSPGPQHYQAPGQQPNAGWPPPGPGYPPPYQGYQVPPGAGTGALSPQDERTWAIAAHLSALVGLLIVLAFVGPLVVMLVQGPKSPHVRANAVEALNFNISVLIYFTVSIILTFVLIGIPLIFATGIMWLVFTIIAAVKASNGQSYRYPLTIRLVR